MARGEGFLKAGDFVKASLEFRTALQIQPASVQANYDLGLVFENLGDLQRARGFFGKAVDQNAKFVPALIHQAKVDLLVGDEDSTLQSAEAALAVEPQNAEAHALRGAVLLRKGELEAAEAEAVKSLRSRSDNTSGIALLAGVRVKQGLPLDALKLLDSGITANPKDVGLRLAKIKIFDDRGDAAAAEAELKEIIVSQPHENSYRLSLARRLIADKKLDEAEKLLRDGIAANPNDATLELALVAFLERSRGAAEAERELQSHVGSDTPQDTYKFALAELYYGNNKKAEARQLMNTIAAKSGDDKNGLAAQLVLARYALNDGKPGEARQLMDNVLKTDGSNGDALLLRGSLSFSEFRYVDAIADLRAALRNSPDLKPALILLARAYIATGETALGHEFFDRALSEDPSNSELRVEFADQLIELGQLDEADRQLTLALQNEPGYGPAFMARAHLLAMQQSWPEAESVARQLIAIPSFAGQGHAVLGKVLASEKKFADAVNELKQALIDLPQSTAAQASLAFAYLDSGDAASAVSYAKSIVARYPKDADAYQLLGDVEAKLSDSADAIAAYQQSIALNAAQTGSYERVVALYIEKGDYLSAMKVLAQGTQALPRNPDLRLALASVEDHLGRFEAAKSDYESVLRERPHDAAAANNLAALIADAWPRDTKLLGEARQLAEASRNSIDPALIDTLGWVQYRLGNLDDALGLLKTAAAGSKDPQIHYHLGIAYKAKGDRVAARSELGLAVADGKPYRGLDEARAELTSD